MLNQTCPYLRTDLIVFPSESNQNKENSYRIKSPDSGEIFEFGEKEFFLCQSLDGKSTIRQIINNFQRQFGIPIQERDFHNFLEEINNSGLLANYSFGNDLSSYNLGQQNYYEDDDELVTEGDKSSVPRWSFFGNAQPFFTNLTNILKPLLAIYPLLLCLVTPIFIIALNLWIKERVLITDSLGFGQKLGSFLTLFLLSLLVTNLVSKAGRGIIARYYGATIRDFGMLIRWGFVPRFYVKTNNINTLTKKQQLLIYSSPLFFRGVLFTIGTFTWYLNLGQGNTLSAWGLLFALMGLVSFIHGALPLRPASPAARMIAIWMNKSANYPRQVFKRSLGYLFDNNGKKSLSGKEIILVLSSLIATSLLCLIMIKITLRFAAGLTRTFPDIFGRGTYYIILFVLLFLGFNYIKNIVFASRRSSRRNNKNRNSNDNNDDNNNEAPDIDLDMDIDQEIAKYSSHFEPEPIVQQMPPPPPPKKPKKNYWRLFFIGLLIALSFFPIPYSIGGECQLLPPRQQEIQAPISGKIAQVFYQGGDGTLIKKGTVIADVVSGDLQNQILTLQEKIREQQAQKQQSLSNLNQLLKGSRQEEIEIAQKQVEVAQQEVNVSLSQVEVARKQVEEAQAELETEQEKLKTLEQQLKSAIVSAEYSQKEVDRLEPLYAEGALPLQRLENSRQQAETDKISIDEKRQNLNTQEKVIQQIAAKLSGQEQNLEQVKQNSVTKEKSLQEARAKLNLVISGNTIDDIEVAQQEVERSNAELNVLQQQLKYTQDQDFSSQLVMPFDGYLVESYLQKKEGSYLNQGDTFATAQDNSKLVAELQVPEYSAGEIALSVPAEVKLISYPNQPIKGKVVKIEPTTREEENQSLVRVFSVQIELEDSQIKLKPGMSGYGKIPQGKKPIIVVLTRPFIRFLQIEFWSWLP